MSETIRASIRPGAYHDSLVLMRLQAALADLPGVLDAGVVMGTAANKELLAAGGLLAAEAASAVADDLVVVVKAASEAAAGEALGRVDGLLAERRAAAGQGFRPKSLATAIKELPEARWVLVSVAGRWASGVARAALDLGRHVFLYSDNVPLAEEVELKRSAGERGLLVLGPDCGTAIVGGVGLGFANRVRRGAVGLVAASGTGLQAVASRIHALGAGISQAIGTGGRDLSAEVGGTSALQALDLLRRDPETRVIVLVSKPPAPEVAARLLAAARATGKPVVVDFLGAPPPARRLGPLRFAASLEDAAGLAVALLTGGTERREVPAPAFASGQRYVRGLFSGGTLAFEALLAARALLSSVTSNLTLPGVASLADPHHSQGHTIVDLGADGLTVGRPHPMIDQDLLLRRLRREGADPETAVVLLDVVLGHGAHPDPAAALAPAIAEARAAAAEAGRTLAAIAVVVGTDEDPQDLGRQSEALTAAGAMVVETPGEAVALAASWLPRPTEGGGEPVPLEAVRPPLAAVNVGLEAFHDSLVAQGSAAVHVAWRPPAGGDERLAALLARMKR